jgi:CRP-like cAMP-binding protein
VRGRREAKSAVAPSAAPPPGAAPSPAAAPGGEWWARVRSGDLVGYLDEAEYARLMAASESAQVEAGHVILHKGGPSRSLLLVEEGRLEVCEESTGETVVVASVGAGGVVGEVGFIDGRPRTQDVRAGTPCRLRRLTRERFLALVHDDPRLFAKLSIALAELLAARFRTTVAELEPVRAFAASLKEPMSLEEAAGFDELEEPLPETALDIIRDLARRSAEKAAGA